MPHYFLKLIHYNCLKFDQKKGMYFSLNFHNKLLFWLLFVPLFGFSQSGPVKILGQLIEDSNETPIENVIVKLIRENDSIATKSTITNAEGYFELQVNKKGKYTLVAQLIGFSSHKKTIQIDDKSIELEPIKLKDKAIALDEVRIEGNYRLKIDVDKKIYRIDANAVTANGTASDILQNIPSVYVNQTGAVTLRGGKVKIYINGKPSGLLGISRSQILDYIPASMIESIEVINDPSSKYDADGSSGIINIVLKKQKTLGINGMIMSSAGTLDRYNTSINFSVNVKKWSVFMAYDVKSFNMASWETKKRASYAQTTRYVNQDWDYFSKTINQNVRLQTEYTFNKKNVLAFSFLHSAMVDKDDSNAFYSHFDVNNALTNFYNRKIFEQDDDQSTNLTLNYTKKFKKKQQQLTADVFYSNGYETTNGAINQVYLNPDFTPTSQLPVIANTFAANRDINGVGQLDYDQPITKKIKMEFGYKIRYRKSNASYRLENYYQPLDIYITDPLLSNTFDYQSNIQAGYATFRNKINQFSYKLGVRMEHTELQFESSANGLSNSQSFTDWFPSLHLLYDIKNNHKFTWRYSRRIDRPAFREINPLQQYNDPLFLSKGNPNLVPEYTHSFDLTHTKSWTKSSISTSVYYRRSTGSIQRFMELNAANGVTTTSYKNISLSENLGVEVAAFVHLFDWWKLNTSANYYRNIIDGTSISPDFKSDRYAFNGKLNHNFTLWKKSLLQVSANLQTPTNAPMMTYYGQFYMDASFKQDFFNKRWSLSLRCTDLLHTQRKYYDINSSNFEVTSRSARESRAFFIGITYRPFNTAKKEKEQEEQFNQEEENN
ncbi:MAG: hypothetical protein CFE24_11600 [Flavobacterium sp. BFFFF2]|nr:MAG: hypothetical protein CFE24_11600 [Flavobacterium sp. BFFFF2]